MRYTSITMLEQFGRRLGIVEIALGKRCDSRFLLTWTLQRAWRHAVIYIVKHYGPNVRVIFSCEQRKWHYLVAAEVYDANICFK